MRFFASIRVIFAAVAALLVASGGLAALCRDAYAGTLRIRDEAHILSASDVAALQGSLRSAPFDGRLVLTATYADAGELSRYVGSLVTEPDVVVIGLDPEHRHVAVHFGSGTHIARSDQPGIERAGNDAFRHGQWSSGIEGILRAAAAAASEGSNGAPGPNEQPGVGARPPASAGSPFGPGVILLIVVAIVGVGIFLARRRAGDTAFAPPGYGPGPYGGTGYPPYPPGSGGLGPMGGGLIGAGLGGLAGYELGKLEGESEERDRERASEDRGGQDADTGGNFDAGGGSSSWDDGGDGGGFDGGGGGDGGGFDGGGGGSDFGA